MSILKKLSHLSFPGLLFFIISSCNNNAETASAVSDSTFPTVAIGTEKIAQEPKIDTISFICATIDPLEKAAILNKYRWDTGQVLRVYFINGSAAVKGKVQAVGSEWSNHCSIKFKTVSKLPAEIRVKFIPGLDSWTTLGTGSLQDQRSPSMYLSIYGVNSETDNRGLILHEFGHALGLIHEHQSPDAKIPWNVPAVYARYRQIPWSDATIRANVLNRYSRTVVTNSKYDRNSIMIYPISEDLLTDPSYAVEATNELSETDKAFIRKVYNTPRPKKAPPKVADDNRGIRGETH